jgi:anthranilate phosphoribosyltransferase
MKEILAKLYTGNPLSHKEAKSTLLGVGQGVHSEVEFASLLTVYIMRPITSEELAGFREAMLELCLATNLEAYNPIDVVGTGGDEKNTFNISTLSCFILAGAGYNVAKHGNYAVSSTSGSSNLLEYLGYQFSNDPSKLKNDLDKAGFCFLHAPLFHPAMKFIAPVRKALKVKTFFNILGPMTNPSSPKYQILGVYNEEAFKLYKEVYKSSGASYFIVNNADGYDEISLTDKTMYSSNVSEGFFTPGDFGFEKIRPEELYGGRSVADAAKLFMEILEGKGTSGQNQVVVANAAVGIKCIEPGKTMAECVAIAGEALKSGKALRSLKKLIPQL